MRSMLLCGLLILFLIPVQVNAQQQETLFANDINHGGFGSLVYGVTSVNGQAAFLRGTRGAWVIRFSDGHAINIGLAGYRTKSNFDTVNWNRHDNEPEMRTNYGGFELEYVNNSYRLIHFGAQTLVGSGTVRYQNGGDFEKSSDDYFVLQPAGNIHLNVTHWFRISGSVLYRYAANVNLDGTGNSDLSGFSVSVGLRFGKF